MSATPPAIRILPMSDRAEGFRGRSIEAVQAEVFLRDLPRNSGRFRYPASGLKAEAGTLVLFQYRARIIASGVFLRDEKFTKAVNGYSGQLHFDPESISTFDPLNVNAMQNVWPWFRAFGHVKQKLNPGLYPAFQRQLKRVVAVSARTTPKRKRTRGEGLATA